MHYDFRLDGCPLQTCHRPHHCETCIGPSNTMLLTMRDPQEQVTAARMTTTTLQRHHLTAHAESEHYGTQRQLPILPPGIYLPHTTDYMTAKAIRRGGQPTRQGREYRQDSGTP